MALNQQQKLVYEKRIHQMAADGFFLPSARSLSGDTRHLIISFGGTGADALFGVKKAFETILPTQQLNERVRFLAIDTDESTQKQTEEILKDDGTKELIEVDSLKPAQFFQLSGSAARNIVGHPELDSNVAQWINPQVVDMINADNNYLSGDGASGVRQIGRLTLFPSNTVSKLSMRISALARELTDNNKTANLRVFILTGIAGGTGSGTVIDLSYLIRDSIPSHLTNRTRYCGFVLLPPTGKGSSQIEINHGNSNGYAALKEINHFMTLKQRKDSYSFTYGDGRTVTSQEPIFDTCYLLDGFSDEMGFTNPRAQAVKVLSEGLLDMVTSSLTVGDETIQAVDSFMNDATTFARTMIVDKSVASAMRDADYAYCALGHSEFSIPANEIKAYVGKQLFDRIYAQFLKCENVENQDVKSFVERVIARGVSGQKATVNAVNAEVNAIFTDYTYGPWFTINLLALVDDEVSRLKSKVRLFRPGSVTDESLNWISGYCAKLNSETFAAYTCAMDGLKFLMESQFGAVVSANRGTRVYSFLPQSLGRSEKAKHIITYLDGLISGPQLRSLCDDLLQEMIDNRDNWVALVQTDVAARNDAPAAMRKFWNVKLDAIVNSTMEDFLIKFYSEDPNAHYSPDNDAMTRPYLENAAKEIYEQMLGNGATAQPLVQLTGRGLSASDFNGHTFLLVPECAPHLYEAIRQYASTHDDANDRVKVCKSLAVDRISCYKQYSGLPAFKMVWVQTAEEIYEKTLESTAGHGLHMSETVGGKQWKNFPNLLPRSSWNALRTPYSCNREKKLAEKADNLFESGRKLKISESSEIEGNIQIYHVKLLPEEFRPSAELYKQLERARPGSDYAKAQMDAIQAAATTCADTLFTKVENWESAKNLVADLSAAGVTFGTRKLRFPNTVISLTSGDDATGWDEKLASLMLRKLPEVMSDLDSTLLVMQILEEKVRKSVESRTLIKRFAQYLAMDMFRFNEQEQAWEYADENGVSHELTYLDSDVELKAEFYFMFNAFRNDPETVAKALTANFNDIIPTDRTNRVVRQTAFREGGANLKTEVLTWLKTRPMKPYEKIAVAKGYDLAAIHNFYNALYQEADEISSVGYIPTDIGTDQDEDDFIVPTGNSNYF